MPASTTPLVLLLFVMLPSAGYAAKSSPETITHPVLSRDTRPFLKEHCIACHKEKKHKGDIRLDNLDQLGAQARNEILNKIEEQLFLEQMPPEDEDQPSEKELSQFFDTIADQFKALDTTSSFREKLKMPAFGNYVNHEDLFSGDYKDLKASTRDRRWLVSEFIFNQKVNELLGASGRATVSGERVVVLGEVNRSVTNPFLLPPEIGVRYYANQALNGGHLLTMLTNAKNLADTLVSERQRGRFPSVKKALELETRHSRTLVEREKFLNDHIDHMLAEVYGAKHEGMLPDFVAVELEDSGAEKGENYKKAPFHAASPGRVVEQQIYRDVKRHKVEGDSDQQILAKCEKAWFYNGLSERKIKRRLLFMKNYMPEIMEKLYEGHNNKARYPDFKALSDSEMKVIRETLRVVRAQGDHTQKIADTCLSRWRAEFKELREAAGLPGEELIRELLHDMYDVLYARSPTEAELSSYSTLVISQMKELGPIGGINKLWQTLILRSEYVYRQEFGQGAGDAHGRRTLSPHDMSIAIAYALTDSRPDEDLQAAAENGALTTREDVRREVERILKKRDLYYVVDENLRPNRSSVTTQPVRKLRFFREFFGYPQMLSIFKDTKRFGGEYDGWTKYKLVEEADLLVEYILEKDKDVIETLLGTEEFYVYHSGNNEDMEKSSERVRNFYEYFKDKGWEDFTREDIDNYREKIVEDFKLKLPGRGLQHSFKVDMKNLAARYDKGQKNSAPFGTMAIGQGFRGVHVPRFFNIRMDDWDYPTTQPTHIPNRKGILTHPAWLIAHAQNTETDPVVRGKWVREKLLAGTVPDVPISVEAVVPEDHHKTLRTRLVGVTEQEECWKCHQSMNPLGYAFEIYDDFGRFRREESLEHPDNLVTKMPDKGKSWEKDGMYQDIRNIYKTLPVDAKGALDGTGDPELDGPVEDALDLMDRLSRSDRVRQSIIRHAFRYFMGRNETLSDSSTLIEAEQAYLKNGGSFDAVIVSLLTSDSFILRKEVKREI